MIGKTLMTGGVKTSISLSKPVSLGPESTSFDVSSLPRQSRGDPQLQLATVPASRNTKPSELQELMSPATPCGVRAVTVTYHTH